MTKEGDGRDRGGVKRRDFPARTRALLVARHRPAQPRSAKMTADSDLRWGLQRRKVLKRRSPNLVPPVRRFMLPVRQRNRGSNQSKLVATSRNGESANTVLSKSGAGNPWRGPFFRVGRRTGIGDGVLPIAAPKARPVGN